MTIFAFIKADNVALSITALYMQEACPQHNYVLKGTG